MSKKRKPLKPGGRHMSARVNLRIAEGWLDTIGEFSRCNHIQPSDYIRLAVKELLDRLPPDPAQAQACIDRLSCADDAIVHPLTHNFRASPGWRDLASEAALRFSISVAQLIRIAVAEKIKQEKP